MGAATNAIAVKAAEKEAITALLSILRKFVELPPWHRGEVTERRPKLQCTAL
jgi:hypothetical protein